MGSLGRLSKGPSHCRSGAPWGAGAGGPPSTWPRYAGSPSTGLAGTQTSGVRGPETLAEAEVFL